MKATSITRVKNIFNPKYPAALVFHESGDIGPEDIGAILVQFDNGKAYVVGNDCETNEDIIFPVRGECPDCEKERIGMKPGLEMESQIAPGVTQVDGIFSKAWSCGAPIEIDEETAKAIKKAMKEGL